MNKRHTTRALFGLLILLAAGMGAAPLTTLNQVYAATAKPALSDPAAKEIAMQLVSSAENASLNWKAQYSYIEDIQDGRGYTGGIIGFCSGTGDMLALTEKYSRDNPGNGPEKYLSALRRVNGSASHNGLGSAFEQAWRAAGKTPAFQTAQNQLRDAIYFNPAVQLAQRDGLSVLGQFIYYDAIVVHGPDDNPLPAGESFHAIRRAALKKAPVPAQGGDETRYLAAFLDARDRIMKQEAAHEDLSRTVAQRKFLQEQNVNLRPPLAWKMYGELFRIPAR